MIPTEIDLQRLPKPDGAGVYWLARPGRGPAILPRQAGTPGAYFASTDKAILFDGTQIKEFATPQAALAELRRVMTAEARKGGK